MRDGRGKERCRRGKWEVEVGGRWEGVEREGRKWEEEGEIGGRGLWDRVEGRGSGGKRDEREKGRKKGGQRKVMKGEIDRERNGGRVGEVQ